MNRSRSRGSSRSWDAVADWYAGWSGPNGSAHHQKLAIPAAMDLLDPKHGEAVLDLGCGPGPLALHVARRGARYTGVDSSRRLLAVARRHNGASGVFVEGDATKLNDSIPRRAFDAVVFLLSLQDIDPLEAAIASAAGALRTRGRLVIVMTHPCFRIPRQSGWGWDAGRKLRFRRIDRYLGRLAVPMQEHAGGRGSTRSYHRPLSDYFAALGEAGFVVDALREIAADSAIRGPRSRSEALSDSEIPLFLGIRALKMT